jgi:uncharacterized protein YecE (DUF72 family)
LSDVRDIVGQFLSGAIAAYDAAVKLSGLAKDLVQDKDWPKLLTSAKEVLHYGDQGRRSDTEQWAQSFRYEMLQSEKEMKKLAKKIFPKLPE